MDKLMELFYSKVKGESEELNSIFEQTKDLSHILGEAFKDREEFDGVKAKFQPFKITDEMFDQIVAILKKSMITSKLFKFPQVKAAILKINAIREFVVYDENFNETEESKKDKSLYERIGKIEGLTKIMGTVFSYVKEDEAIANFYREKDLAVMQKRYAYFIAG